MTTTPSTQQTDIIDAVQVSDPGSALIVLYEVEVEPNVYAYFTPFNETDLSEIKFPTLNGSTMNTYHAIPIEADGFDVSSTGAYNRPVLTVANISSLFSDNVGLDYEKLTGKTVIRRTTLAKYLVGGSAYTAGDKPIEFPRTVYRIDRIKEKNILQVQFELATPFDLPSVTLPRRKVFGGRCPWKYKGAHEEISEGNKVGGCTWSPDKGFFIRASLPDGTTFDSGYTPEQLEEAKESFPIFLTENDEYIVNKDQTVFYDITDNYPSNPTWDDGAGNATNVLIEIGQYFRTSDTATKIEPDGRTKTVTSIFRYWQATHNMDLSNASGGYTDVAGNEIKQGEMPSSASSYYREIRVYSLYDPVLSHAGYTQKQYNEYVISVDGITERYSIPFTDFSSISLTPNTFAYDLVKIGVYDSNFIVSGLSKNIFDLAAESYGAVENVSYVYNKGVLYIQNKGSAGGVELQTYDSISSTVKRVKSATVEPQTADNIHITNPGTGDKWVTGDICGKNIGSCSSRFQSSVIEYISPGPAGPAVPLEVKLNSAAAVTAGGYVQLQSQSNFDALPSQGTFREMVQFDFLHFLTSSNSSSTSAVQEDTVEANEDHGLFLNTILQGSAGNSDGWVDNTEYRFGFGGLNATNNNRITNFTMPNGSNLEIQPPAFYSSDPTGSETFQSMLFNNSHPLFSTNPYRGQGDAANFGHGNRTPVYNPFISQLYNAGISAFMDVTVANDPGIDDPGHPNYSTYLVYRDFISQFHNFFQYLTPSWRKVQGGTREIEIYYDSRTMWQGTDMLAPTPIQVPISFSIPASTAYQQFAYSLGNYAGAALGQFTDEYLAGGFTITEDDFLTGKLYLTDDRTETGNDIILPFREVGAYTSAGGVTQIEITKNSTIPLPFGGYPGSRRFQ